MFICSVVLQSNGGLVLGNKDIIFHNSIQTLRGYFTLTVCLYKNDEKCERFSPFFSFGLLCRNHYGSQNKEDRLCEMVKASVLIS